MATDTSQIKKLISEVRYNANSFQIYNKNKIEDCLKEFSKEQREAFLLIPYFLHTNCPKKLSAIKSGEHAPCGISKFKWGTDVQPIVRKYFGAGEELNARDTDKKPAIEFLSLMGSVGSIAYTDKSDFDFWCCVRNDLEESEKEKLQEKLINIEKWCETELKVEAHFFITTQKLLSENNFGEVSKESCGSALGKLLKEEYFRGSLLLAGKIPYWWGLPVGVDDNAYGKLVEYLDRQDEYHVDFIDIGNIHSIPEEEFLGGGLWQLNKGVESIFKSILKMALLVAYSDKKEKHALLANVLRKKVHENINLFKHWDAYQSMMDLVLEYYQKFQPEFIDLLRKCFFIKISVKVSVWFDANKEPEKNNQKVMLKYCKEWEWNRREIEHWEEIDALTVNRVSDFKHETEKFMMKSFEILNQRIGYEKLSKILSEKDLVKMTNRLALVYDSSRKRAEFYYPPFNKVIQSKSYTLKMVQINEDEVWRLYRDEHDLSLEFSQIEEKNLLRQSDTFSRVLTWLIYNNLIHSKTKLFSQFYYNDQFSHNVKVLSEVYKNIIGIPKQLTLDSDELIDNPVPEKWVISVNLIPRELDEGVVYISEVENKRNKGGRERPLFSNKLNDNNTNSEKGNIKVSKIEQVLSQFEATGKTSSNETLKTVVEIDSKLENNKKLTNKFLSTHEDPMNAWGAKDCLFREAFLFEKNTWGEVVCRDYQSSLWVVELLVYLLNHINPKIKIEDQLGIAMGQDFYDLKKFKDRFTQLFHSVFKFFVFDSSDIKKVYCLMIGGKYAWIENDGENYFYGEADSYQKMAINLNIKFTGKIKYHFDEGNSLGRFYQSAINNSVEGVVNVFFQKTTKGIDYVIVDEIGHMSFHSGARDDLRLFFPRYVYGVSTCLKLSSEIYKEIQGHEKKSSLRISWYKRDGETEEMVNITTDTLKVIPSAIKRLTELDMVMNWSSYENFLKKYCESNKFIFDSEISKNEFKTMVQNIKKVRKAGDLEVKQYPLFISDLRVIFDDEENVPFNICYWFNLKLTLERACAYELQLKS